MQVYYTNDARSAFTSVLLCGESGAGKTPIAATAPNPIMVVSEPGLKSLASQRIPYVYGHDHKTAMEVLAWLKGSSETKKYHTCVFDSVSMLSETILIAEKKKSSDARRYSPETVGKVMEVVLGYIGLAQSGRMNIVMTCKVLDEKDDLTNATKKVPFAVQPKLGPSLPYHFDDVLLLARHRNFQTGQDFTALQCRWSPEFPNGRNRLGKLDLYEPPDLLHIFNKELS